MRKLSAALLGLTALLPGSAAAEFVFQPSAVHFAVGPALLENNIGTTLFLAGRVDLGTFTDRLVWDAGLHWWQKSETVSYTFGGFTSEVETSYRDIAVASGVKFLIPVQSVKWLPYARGGLALNFVNASASASSGGISTDVVSAGSTDLGVQLGGGVSYRYSPSFQIGSELMLNVTDADHILLGVTASFPFGAGGKASGKGSGKAKG
jgi:opacity protein-like surface antigen